MLSPASRVTVMGLFLMGGASWQGQQLQASRGTSTRRGDRPFYLRLLRLAVTHVCPTGRTVWSSF